MRRFLPRELFEDILSGNHVNTTIIPNNISPSSKMYKKALNFNKSTDIFWKNTGPLTINYIPTLSSTKLNNVDVLLTDINNGYMLGWVSNNKIPVLVDDQNALYYTNIAVSERIPCKINGVSFT